MIPRKNISWWYWALMAALLAFGLAARLDAFFLIARLVALLQIVHFRLWKGSFTAFPVQVRLVYAAILMAAMYKPLNWVLWLVATGRFAQVIFGYCALARSLSLMPCNRSGPLSLSLIYRTFTARPVRGNLLQSQSALD